MTFLTKLAAASRARDTVICIGLDPEPDRIPEHLGRGAQAAVRFLRRIVKATSDDVCCYKPNMAFYERYGSAGLDILALTLEAIPADVPVILDAKRGDVPNTANAYAEALFDRFHADAVTVAPYVGLDGIAPFNAKRPSRSIAFPRDLTAAAAEAEVAAAMRAQTELLRSRRGALEGELAIVRESVRGLELQLVSLNDLETGRGKQVQLFQEQLASFRSLNRQDFVHFNRCHG